MVVVVVVTTIMLQQTGGEVHPTKTQTQGQVMQVVQAVQVEVQAAALWVCSDSRRLCRNVDAQT